MATEQEILSFRDTVEKIRREIAKEIVGQQEVVGHLVLAMIAGGNVLLEGVPGLGKTRLVRTLSRVFDLPFSRIQFTPDLMPADITGTNIIEKTESGNAFRFQPGPLFASIVPPPPFTVQALSIHWSPDRAESFQMRRSVWPLRLSVPLLTPLMPQR